MFNAEGVYAFGGYLLVYLIFISVQMRVMPWELWFYDSRVVKAAKD